MGRLQVAEQVTLWRIPGYGSREFRRGEGAGTRQTIRFGGERQDYIITRADRPMMGGGDFGGGYRLHKFMVMVYSYYLYMTKGHQRIQQIAIWGKRIGIKKSWPWQAMLDIMDGCEQPDTCYE